MNKKVIATCQLTNFGGIAIFSIVYGIEDKVKFSYFNSEKYSRVSTSIIRTDKKGDAYFISFGQKYYLREFI